MSDLIRSHDNSNIKGWFAEKMGGNPHLNEAKWLDRSPETHTAHLKQPILLLHGDQDNRVPTIESRELDRKLTLEGKVHRYVELKDEGHGFSRNGTLIFYHSLFNFLEEFKSN
jgi:dipeptidyl aminopeptidase/acylaminoacyl peptidase